MQLGKTETVGVVDDHDCGSVGLLCMVARNANLLVPIIALMASAAKIMLACSSDMVPSWLPPVLYIMAANPLYNKLARAQTTKHVNT